MYSCLVAQLLPPKPLKQLGLAVFLTDITQIRSILGACCVSRKFINDFSKVAMPLNDYKRKDKKMNWSDTTTAALIFGNIFTLKSKLLPPAGDLPQQHGPKERDTDASLYAWRAVVF